MQMNDFEATFFHDNKEKQQVWVLMMNPLQLHRAVSTIPDQIRSTIQAWFP